MLIHFTYLPVYEFLLFVIEEWVFLELFCNIFDAVLVPNVKNNYQNDDTIENYFMIQEQ